MQKSHLWMILWIYCQKLNITYKTWMLLGYCRCIILIVDCKKRKQNWQLMILQLGSLREGSLSSTYEAYWMSFEPQRDKDQLLVPLTEQSVPTALRKNLREYDRQPQAVNIYQGPSMIIIDQINDQQSMNIFSSTISMYVNARLIRDEYHFQIIQALFQVQYFKTLAQMSFLTGSKILKYNISKQLEQILILYCVECRNRFDLSQKRPNLLMNCQHYICNDCLQKQLKGNDPKCDECSTSFNPMEVYVDRYLERINELKIKASKLKELHQIEIIIAQDLKYDFLGEFKCVKCKEKFDMGKRQPFAICNQMHVLCKVCLQTEQQKSNFSCLRCHQKIQRKTFKVYKLFLDMLQFIQTTLMNRRVQFQVDERTFKLSLGDQVTIRQIFFFLQQYKLISPFLQINECSFYHGIYKDYEAKKILLKNDQKIRDISKQAAIKIMLQFSMQAIKKGAVVTKASKILNQMSIKINDYSPSMMRNYGQQKVQKPKQAELNRSIKQYMDFRISSKQQIAKQNQKNVLYPDLQDLSELHEMNKKSSQKLQQIARKPLFKMVEKQVEMKEIGLRKKQSIPKRKQCPKGTQISYYHLQDYVTKGKKVEERDEIYNQFIDKHLINSEDDGFICLRTRDVSNIPFNLEEVTSSMKEEEEFESKAKQGGILSLILLVLKKELEDGQIKVVFTPTSTPRSRVSLKIITSHFISDRVVIKETLHEDQKFYFQKYYKSPQNLALFIASIKKRASSSFGISQDNIVVHSIEKGDSCQIVRYSTNEGEKIAETIKRNVDKNLSLQPFFNYLVLCKEDLDTKGHIAFKSSKNDVEFRGKWPYFQPINSIREGFRVFNKFDDQKNTWLSMKNILGEWAVGFHPVKNPNSKYKDYKCIIESILKCRIQDQGPRIFVEGQFQSFKNNPCINKDGEKVGEGVELTPSFYFAVGKSERVEFNGKSYHLVFQCRLRPDAIRVDKYKQLSWIINESAAIRPYGIILIEHKQVEKYPTIEQQFGKPYSFEYYKARLP